MLHRKSSASKIKSNQNLIGMLLVGVGLFGLATSALIFTLLRQDDNNDADSGFKAKSLVNKKELGLEEPYTVPAENPKFIEINKLGISETKIIALGISNNQIVNPPNINDVGWYKESKKPGEEGSMFLYGHLSDWTNDGVFSRLKELSKGDEIKITRGDDKTFSYRVNLLKKYNADKVDMEEVLNPIQGKRQGLSIMTCAGKVIAGTNDFDERLVVFAETIEP